MARPSKLTPALLTKLDEIADDCWSIKDACAKIEIDRATWFRWLQGDPEDELVSRFCDLAARVSNSAGSKIDDLAWGALREVLEDPTVKNGDKITAATNALRLRTSTKVELTGRDGGPLEVIERANRDLDSRLDSLAARIAEGAGTPEASTNEGS